MRHLLLCCGVFKKPDTCAFGLRALRLYREPFWPGTLSAGSRAFPKGDAVMFSVFAMCGDIGCCIGPWLLGIIADVTDLHVGFAVSSVFPIIMIITAVLFFKEEKIAGKQTP